VVRPLINLLHTDKTAIENFEALMALTNLAQVNEATRLVLKSFKLLIQVKKLYQIFRKSMLKENGFTCIEQYMFDEHPMLRRASTQCICNLVQEEEVGRLN
jgi:hypothetical protein